MELNEAAKNYVSRTTPSRLLNGHSGISLEMALRLSKLLVTSIQMWINLQSQYDIWLVMQHENEFNTKN